MADEDAGETFGFYRRIQISEDSDTIRRWRTLVHEWVHAAMYVNGIGSAIGVQLDEVIAQTMEHVIEEMFLQIGKEFQQVLTKEYQL